MLTKRVRKIISRLDYMECIYIIIELELKRELKKMDSYKYKLLYALMRREKYLKSIGNISGKLIFKKG